MPILTPQERIGLTMAGKYRLESILATGGMATVFAGVHAWTEREVAVKILNYEHAREPEVVRRFLQEARAAAQLKHPNVVDVLDMGEDTDGTVYLVLERLHGETLKARLRRGPLTLREVAALILPVMRAVASAHQKGVVHRDIKPDNIFLSTTEPGSIVPKLLDFGIAKVSAASDSGSTRTGLMVGTPSYMAPEQVRGERDVGPRADVWSMGVVLHAAITGRVPFEAESSAAVLARVITERAAPIQTLAPQLRPSVASVVDRALVFEAHARFADMGEMVAALEAALEGPSQGYLAPVPARAPAPILNVAATGARPLASQPGLAPELLTDAPTVNLPLGALQGALAPKESDGIERSDLDVITQPGPMTPEAAANLPATTPFAWAAAPPPPSPTTPSSPRWPWVVGAIAALALAGGGMALVWPWSSAAPVTASGAPRAVSGGGAEIDRSSVGLAELGGPTPPSTIQDEPPPSTEASPATEAAPSTPAAPPPATEAAAAPPPATSTPLPSPAGETTTATADEDAGVPQAPRADPSVRAPRSGGREPRRGTRGSYILH